jgi:hypothetical protein
MRLLSPSPALGPVCLPHLMRWNHSAGLPRLPLPLLGSPPPPLACLPTITTITTNTTNTDPQKG